MIKINLLGGPRRKKTRKSVEIQFQVILGSVVLSLLLGVLGFFWMIMGEKVTALEDQKRQLTQDLETLKAQVKEVENYESDKKVFEERIRIIQRLRKIQSGPVRLLDEVSRTLPDRVWLASMTEIQGTVEVEGKAITNSEIVDFINNLKRSTLFENVQLIESRQSAENNIPIYSFRLQWSIVS